MTRKPPVRLWNALDEIPEATTDRREWRLALQDEWPAAAPYLTPTGRLAKEIACHSPGGDGCPRKVVKLADSRVRAVCGNRPAECDAIDLKREDVACLALDRKALAKLVCAVLSANADYHENGAVAHLGSHAVAAGIGIPILLLVPGPRADVPPNIMAAPDEDSGPRAIVVPTRRSLPDAVKGALQARGDMILALSDITVLDENSRLVGTQPAVSILAPLRDKLLAKEQAAPTGRVWLLPPEARWEDLTFDFIAEEVVNVRYRDRTRRFEPEEFGMKNRKNGRPTVLWVLFQAIAQRGGSLTWVEQKAATRIKKQKQLLSDALRHLFGIQDDPIPWRRAQAAYVARFVVRDSIPITAQRRPG